MRKWKNLVIATAVFTLVATNITLSHRATAQEIVSPTPVPVIIPSATPLPTEQVQATATFTPTPTPLGVVIVEVPEGFGPVNVRAEPDINSERLGAIRDGERFPALGFFGQWYQIQYDPSPTGKAWVYRDLVTIIGDPAALQEVNVFAEPTVDTSIVGATQTWEAITQTPGGILTATANARVLPAPGTRIAPLPGEEAVNGDILPTFTYPPNIPPGPPENLILATTPTPSNTPNGGANGNNIPPIGPIIILGALGMLGLFVNSMRR